MRRQKRFDPVRRLNSGFREAFKQRRDLQSRRCLRYNIPMKRKTLKNDILLVLALLLLALAVWGALRLTKKPGGEAVVTVDGRLVATLPLSVEATLPVGSQQGFLNVVEVSGGRVRVADADCPDRLCVRQGWIGRDGESIVCLPHRLVVAVRATEGDLDAVAR